MDCFLLYGQAYATFKQQLMQLVNGSAALSIMTIQVRFQTSAKLLNISSIFSATGALSTCWRKLSTCRCYCAVIEAYTWCESKCLCWYCNSHYQFQATAKLSSVQFHGNPGTLLRRFLSSSDPSSALSFDVKQLLLHACICTTRRNSMLQFLNALVASPENLQVACITIRLTVSIWQLIAIVLSFDAC